MAKIKERKLTTREKFVMAAMQAMIQIKGSHMNNPTYEISRNVEDVCNDIAQASVTVADETLKVLNNGKN